MGSPGFGSEDPLFCNEVKRYVVPNEPRGNTVCRDAARVRNGGQGVSSK